MLVADIVLLPVVPGAADVWALQETLAVLEDARGLRPELIAGLVLNRADRTTLAGMTREAIKVSGGPCNGDPGQPSGFWGGHTCWAHGR